MSKAGSSEHSKEPAADTDWADWQLKVGSFARSERMVKWNECLRIERNLGEKARFVGADIYQALRAWCSQKPEGIYDVRPRTNYL